MDAVNHASSRSDTGRRDGASAPCSRRRCPATMPVQQVHQWEPTDRVWPALPPGRARWRRTVVLTCVLALTAVASYEMYRVLTVHSMTTLQLAFLVLFTLTFVWIALPCRLRAGGLARPLARPLGEWSAAPPPASHAHTSRPAQRC